MAETITDLRERRWALAHVLYALLLTLFTIYGTLNVYLSETVERTYVLLSVPLAVVFYYFFRGLRDGLECRLLAIYALWFYLTRVMNGQLWLQTEFEFKTCCGMALCSVLLPVGMLLSREGRRKYLNWLTGTVGLFYFAVGLLGFCTVLTGRRLINPITEKELSSIAPAGPVTRLTLLETHPNIMALLLFIALFLMICQFFACRRKLWRVPIVLAALVYYVNIAFTFSRTTMLAFAICFGLVLLLLARRAFPRQRLAAQILTAVLVMGLAVPAGYKSFDLTVRLVSAAAASEQAAESGPAAEEGLRAKAAPAAAAVPLAAAETAPAENLYEDKRDFGGDMLNLNGRTAIFRGGLLTLLRDPIRILRGSQWADIMPYVNQYTAEPHEHMHNYLMQVLMVTGLPGFLLVLAISLLLLLRIGRVFLSTDPAVGMPVRVLGLLLLGFLIDSLMEVNMFSSTDERGLLFFLLAGLFLAESYDIFPPAEGRLFRRKKGERV